MYHQILLQQNQCSIISNSFQRAKKYNEFEINVTNSITISDIQNIDIHNLILLTNYKM